MAEPALRDEPNPLLAGVEIEQPPPFARGRDEWQYGGSLFFSRETGLAGCVKCGWSGVPTTISGVISTYCPACERLPTPPRIGQGSGRKKDAKRKAQRQARKRNRR